MKREGLHQKCICFLFISLLTNFFTLNLSAGVMDTDIEPLDGNWWERERGSSIKSPISASINGSTLIIQCTSCQSDIIVTVTNDSGYYYKETILTSEAYFANIDLANTPQGKYTLLLTNQWGGHLTGSFKIN